MFDSDTFLLNAYNVVKDHSDNERKPAAATAWANRLTANDI